ncbi:putative bifunctional diguanylate cyclase/phosphodiesterase [Spongisporangium articulatum]|uniref:Bifunctional diguanylate cyclase/phosphodiesterase n=1 Tax=Spongisporangium articulatum TaxID=3362603 RepID=A0ABW8AST1_9ACTN
MPYSGDLDEVVELAGQIPFRLRMRALGLLWIAGASLALVWVRLTELREGRSIVVAMAVGALVWGLVMTSGVFNGLGARRLGRHDVGEVYLHVAIALIQVVITIAYAAAADPANDIRLFYVWATPYAALFFTRRLAVLHSVWVALLMFVVLGFHEVPAAQAVALWLTTIGLVGVATFLVAWVSRLNQRSRDRLRHLAEHDFLTGLPNRRMFGRLLRDSLQNPHVTTTLLLVDLDSFKMINDSHGHDSGDRLLSEVAPRLAALIGPRDILARVGGDEFAVLHEVPGAATDPDGHERARDSAMVLANRLTQAWRQRFTVAGGVYASGCVGVSVSLGSAAGGGPVTAGALLREADTALYRAKEAGRSAVHLYDEDLRNSALRRLELESHLRGAAGRGELSLVYQPIVTLDDGRPVGVEALCRWNSPVLGSVPPDRFIQVAEDSGLIDEIGDFVLAEATRQIARWQAGGLLPPRFAVTINVSPIMLRAGLAAQVRDAVELAGVPAERLAIELTERLLISPTTEVSDELGQLRAAGHTLMLDDFGTGYSSLSSLARLPVDVVKVDRGFVAAMGSDRRAEGVVQAVLRLAQTLGMVAVAEGVETGEQAQRLLDLGCDRAQGWFYGRPVPPAEIETLLRAHGPVHVVG